MVRYFLLLLACSASTSWAITPAASPHSSPPRAETSHKVIHYCTLSQLSHRHRGCVDPILAAANAVDAFDAKCLRQKTPTPECYAALRTRVGVDQIELRRLEEQMNRLKKNLSSVYYPRRRPRAEIEEANRVFSSEFSDLRKTPGADKLASDLVVERMKDPHYADVPLDIIVRDVASQVRQVATAGNEKLVAEVEAEKREAEETRENATKSINDAYDQADRAVAAAQAIVQDSASDADTAGALAIINSSTPAAMQGPIASAPYVHCTSHTIGQRQYAHVETECN